MWFVRQSTHTLFHRGVRLKNRISVKGTPLLISFTLLCWWLVYNGCASRTILYSKSTVVRGTGIARRSYVHLHCSLSQISACRGRRKQFWANDNFSVHSAFRGMCHQPSSLKAKETPCQISQERFISLQDFIVESPGLVVVCWSNAESTSLVNRTHLWRDKREIDRRTKNNSHTYWSSISSTSVCILWSWGRMLPRNSARSGAGTSLWANAASHLTTGRHASGRQTWHGHTGTVVIAFASLLHEQWREITISGSTCAQFPLRTIVKVRSFTKWPG